MPAPGNGNKNAAVKTIRRALIAVSRDDSGGQMVPLNALRTRVEALMATQRDCDYEQVGRTLLALIRDLHTSMAAGRDMGELLALVLLLHVQGTQAFLHSAGVSPDLCWQAATLARQAAREHDGADVLGLAAFGAANGLLATGKFDIAQAELDSVVVPRTTEIAEQLDGMLTLATSIAEELRPDCGDVRGRRRASATTGKTDLPARVQRRPFVREVLAELLARLRRDAAGREVAGDGLPGAGLAV